MLEEILLIDVDSKFGNLYLMQLSAYYKAQGAEVYLNDGGNPTKVFISCLYKKNRAQALGRAKLYPNAEVFVGGTEVNYLCGDPAISKLRPDYCLYPSKESLGRTTFGCANSCPWCCVPQKEGRFMRWQHISEFYDERFDTVHLLDNNILTDMEWFKENMAFLLAHNLKLREGGMDIRLLTPEIAELLRNVNIDGFLHFAWDRLSDEEAIIRGILMLQEVGFDTRHEISVYVLTNYNTSIEEDIHRIETLRALDTNPFIMVYDEDNHKANRGHKQIARRVNRKAIFWSNSFSYPYQGISPTVKTVGILPRRNL